MDERQKLQSDLKRYRTLRDLIHDERATATLEEMIREAEDRLRQLEHAEDQAGRRRPALPKQRRSSQRSQGRPMAHSGRARRP
jgi:hypothetical protein